MFSLPSTNPQVSVLLPATPEWITGPLMATAISLIAEWMDSSLPLTQLLDKRLHLFYIITLIFGPTLPVIDALVSAKHWENSHTLIDFKDVFSVCVNRFTRM